MLELLELDLPNKTYGNLWLIELDHNQAICMDVNLWYDHDKFWGKNTYDLSVPSEWAHHKLYQNAWIVGIGPSKQKLWLMELEQITKKPITWTLIYVTITKNFEGKNTYDLSVACEWSQHKLYKKMLELLELYLPNKSYG